jgi:hypothetical protein
MTIDDVMSIAMFVRYLHLFQIYKYGVECTIIRFYCVCAVVLPFLKIANLHLLPIFLHRLSASDHTSRKLRFSSAHRR